MFDAPQVVEVFVGIIGGEVGAVRSLSPKIWLLGLFALGVLSDCSSEVIRRDNFGGRPSQATGYETEASGNVT
ncbi:unnamed protein product [Rhodiola kirilowii]